MAERSSIEVFFKALGDQEVQRAFLNVAASSKVMRASAADLGAGGVGNLRNFSRAFDAIATGSNGASLRFASAARTGRAAQKDFEGAFSSLEKTTRRAYDGFVRVGEFGVRAFDRIGGAVEGAIGFLERLTIAAGATSLAIAAGLGETIKNIVDSSAEATRSVVGLRALDDEADPTGRVPKLVVDRSSPNGDLKVDETGRPAGSDERLDADYAFAQKQADRLGIATSDIVTSLTRIKSGADGQLSDVQIQNAVQGLLEATTANLATSAQRQRGAYALEEIAGGGNLQTRQLRQLNLAAPGTLSGAARAYGTDEKTFRAAVEAGQVDGADFVNKISAYYHERFGKSVESALQLEPIALGRLENAFQRAKTIIDSVTLSGSVKRLFDSITAILERLSLDGTLERFGQQLAADVDRLTAFFVKNQDAVGSFLAVIAAAGRLSASVLEHVFQAVVDVGRALTSPVYSDNPFIALFQGALAVMRALAGAVEGFKPGSGLDATRGVLFEIVGLLDQVAAAITELSTGQANPFYDSLPSFVAIRNALGDIGKAFDEVERLGSAFATGALKAISDEASAGFPDVKKYLDALGDLFTNKAAPKDGTLGTLFQIRDTAETVVTAFLKASGHVAGLIDVLGGLLGAITPGSTEADHLANTGKILEAIFTVRLLKAVGTFKVIGGAIKAVQAIAEVAALATTAVGLGPLIGITLAVVGVVAALAFIAYEAYKHFDEIRKFIVDTFEGIVHGIEDGFKGLWEGIVTGAKAAVDLIKDLFRIPAAILGYFRSRGDAAAKADAAKAQDTSAAEKRFDAFVDQGNRPKLALPGPSDDNPLADAAKAASVPNPVTDPTLFANRFGAQDAVAQANAFAVGFGKVQPPAGPSNGLNNPFVINLPDGTQGTGLIDDNGFAGLADYQRQQNARTSGPLPQAFGPSRG